jgi:hypothetical protein
MKKTARASYEAASELASIDDCVRSMETLLVRKIKFSEHSVNIQGTFREHSVNIQGPFSEHSVNIQGPFSEHSVNIQ